MSTPNDMRKFLGYMYGKKPVKIQDINVHEEKKEMSMRDMLGKMRRLNEANSVDISTNIDQKSEEEKFNKYFGDNNVTIDFEDLKVFPNGVIFGGSIDGQIMFTYRVTPEDETSGVETQFPDGFNVEDPENDEIIKKLESYYDIFYKYWRDQLFKN